MNDKIIENLIKEEEQRQKDFVQLIASENYVSPDVEIAAGSKLTNKYAEGYPGKRYYSGCETVDKVEQLAIDRLKKLFNVNFANVQPHSGSQANFAVLTALLKPGDKIMGLSLSSGGHLTHGHFVNASGQIYKSVQYEVSHENEMLDFEEIRKIALKEKPQLIICGYSAYPRVIDFKQFRSIADEVGAYLMADIAHISGLIATKLHPSPVEHAHVITSTTHKTLRGPRGGIIMTNYEDIAQKVDRAIFPGTQGGPLMHIIAAKAVAFEEASSEQFINYQKQVIVNARTMADFFNEHDAKVITRGTSNHLFLIDTKTSYDLTGSEAEQILYKIGIIVNKNSIPFDTEGPTVTSGIRIGTPAMTTKGFTKEKFYEIAKIIHNSLKEKGNNIELYKKQVKELLK